MSGIQDGIVKRGNTWSYVLRITDTNGISKPRWVGGYRTKNDAKTARDTARVAAKRGQYVDRSDVTVQEYLTSWIEIHALEIKPKTMIDYRNIMQNYIYPHIGNRRLQDLRPTTLSKLYRDLLISGSKKGGPLSIRTIQYTHAVLRKAFNDAMRTDQLIVSNPTEKAKRPKMTKRTRGIQAWTGAQLSAFLEHAQSHRLSAYFRLAAYSGARRGELLHARWSHLVTEGNPGIWIRGSVGVVDGQRVEGTTKSGKDRFVTLDSDTMTILADHRATQDKDRATAMDSWYGDDYIFCNILGEPLFPDTPSALMGKLQARYTAVIGPITPESSASRVVAELPRIRLHDLRHTHATLLLKAGVPVHVVAARLGHADPAITLRVYAHVLGDQASNAATAFATIVDNETGC